jgi:NAD(P)-dependent dehydrogenase (short-subunit alcohol dehydrogenase family)
MDRLSGKTAIVTGAASGLGTAIATVFAQEGATVIATDVNETNGRSVVEAMIKGGGRAVFIPQDVALESDWQTLMAYPGEHNLGLDILVNCAGVFCEGSIEALTLEEWRQVMSVNLDGVFLGIKYAAQIMKQNGGGSIINLSSVGGLVGTMDSAPYNASKGGVRLLTKAAAIEFSKAGYDYNIRVNSIHPGVIETPMTAPMINDPQGGAKMLSWTPMGHFGEPLDVAYGALYLASDESKFLTGAELVIDGGWSAQ